MKYFQFATVDQKMFSISSIKFSKINLHSLSIALYTLYALDISNPNWMAGTVYTIPQEKLTLVALNI